KQKNETNSWRIRFFPREDEARNFAGEFDAVKDLYARANRNALPVREKADRLSRQVYRLRQNEEMKILELSTTPSDENGLQGFWYKVLTEEGVTGFCFNYYLTLYNAKTDTIISTSQDSAQEALAAILTNPWRPEFFREMAAAGRIDLARFRASYGLFFDQDPPALRIALPRVSFTALFSRIHKAAGDAYIAEGSDVQMKLRAKDTELVVSYVHAGVRRNDVFVAFKDNVEELVAREEERRRGLLAAFLRNGSVLRSDAYGAISISETGEFSWTEYGRLVPSVIPARAGSEGTVEFSVFATGEAQNIYGGIISFRFAGVPQPRHFFYRFTQQGTQLIHIPPENIEENLVRKRPVNPLVLFFTSS
ncbi:MAG: SH3 domain-containing protein, partial [Spirochaetaceae bacterium]|nr:SH3 domain-containing protein [Spirochaetaceae bacterium]